MSVNRGLGQAPCNTSSSKNTHGSQLLWAPTSLKIVVGGTYHKKEGATLHPGVRKHSLQYERRPDGCFGTWNLGCLSTRGR